MDYKLRDYQEKTKTDIEKFLFESSYKKGLDIKPVGTGKSLDVAITAEMWTGNCLVIQPREELLDQNLEKARSFGMDPSIYSASKKMKNISKLTYATGMSLVKSPEDFKNFDLVIIDEAHMSLSNKISGNKVSEEGKLVQFLNQINPKKILGLTATPIQLVTTSWGSELKMVNRSKRSYWYQSDVASLTQIEDIKDEYWAEIETIQVRQDESMLELNSTGSDFKLESIIKQYTENDTHEKIKNQYDILVDKGCKSILIFVPSINQAEELKKHIPGIEALSENTGKKERREIISAFKSGQLRAIANVDILSTGFDYQKIDGIIIARNTNSLTVHYQQCGRGVRPIVLQNGTVVKKKCTIVDLTGNTKRFGSIEDISIEKQDYTKGWAMWAGDKILTGYVFGEWDTPSREDVKKAYQKMQVKIEKNDDFEMPWGKYKGKKLKQVVREDKRYFTWMLENKEFSWKGDANKALRKEIERIIFELTIEQQ